MKTLSMYQQHKLIYTQPEQNRHKHKCKITEHSNLQDTLSFSCFPFHMSVMVDVSMWHALPGEVILCCLTFGDICIYNLDKHNRIININTDY